MSSSRKEARVAVSLQLLDGFAIVAGEDAVSVPPGAERLLALLALHPHPVARSHAAGLLWFSTSQEEAAANLRSAIWRIRHAYPGPELVVAHRFYVSFAAHVRVDARRQGEVAQAVLQSSGGDERVDCQVLLDGDLLPDWYDDWVESEREHLKQLRLHALELRAERLTGLGRVPEAVCFALAAVRADPLRESARTALIRAFLAEGNRTDALNQYRSYARLLKRRIGVDPPGRLQDLVDSALVSD